MDMVPGHSTAPTVIFYGLLVENQISRLAKIAVSGKNSKTQNTCIPSCENTKNKKEPLGADFDGIFKIFRIYERCDRENNTMDLH